jgi:endonuclease/exonuclease/phosphatase family metal-dependent hydrolase
MGVRLRVVAYNIHSSRDDLTALASVVKGLNPDILIVQEGPRRLRWRTKAASLAHSFHMVYATGGQESLGNIIITNLKVRVRETWDVRFPLKPGRHMRGAAFARCEIGGAGFTVVGTHLATDPQERPGQAELLRREIEKIEGPVILGGDLNDTPGSPTWESAHAGLVDVGDRMGSGDVCTFPCRGADRRLDTIAVSEEFGLAAYHVEMGDQTRRASDHFPVVADVTL